MIEKAYIIGVHKDTFRPGEPAIIKNVKYTTPVNLKRRLGYEVEYMDGFMDYIAVSEVENGNNKIVSISGIHPRLVSKMCAAQDREWSKNKLKRKENYLDWELFIRKKGISSRHREEILRKMFNAK